jgi:YidC/Oxa1 family membrane protein insertase
MNPITFLVENMMLPFLTFSYEHIVPNYGIAILLLTLVIKIIFYPLTNKQFQSMQMQKKIQPEIKKLQEKYKGEPEKLQKEMMKVWKENKANPLSGCLPTLIQLPFFFAIFYTMKSDAFMNLIAQPGVNPGLFPFWVSNLGVPDKTFILPVLVGISTYLSQKMMTTDPKQAKIFMFMPFFMVFICLKMPTGVLLYWATSQILSVAQQYMIMKRSEIKSDIIDIKQ